MSTRGTICEARLYRDQRSMNDTHKVLARQGYSLSRKSDLAYVGVLVVSSAYSLCWDDADFGDLRHLRINCGLLNNWCGFKPKSLISLTIDCEISDWTGFDPGSIRKLQLASPMITRSWEGFKIGSIDSLTFRYGYLTPTQRDTKIQFRHIRAWRYVLRYVRRVTWLRRWVAANRAKKFVNMLGHAENSSIYMDMHDELIIAQEKIRLVRT
jgi:hypothetical protein